ncbi:MAG: hypothetical protein D6705_09965 [Deltaproteobacteria bacterium]|nr:MAG: hypothetical protein D6705_09965 [Deltaproteobacteria bacterium]
MRRLVAFALLTAACNGGGRGDGDTGAPIDLDDPILDPEACEECHPKHFAQWQGSMHAYAAEDPVFRAMNARGQRETNGELGDFCISCHAPLAVRLGLTEDGLNLDEIPRKFHGVTCYFCHDATDVTDSHNAPIELAWDGIMRGNVTDPAPNDFHDAAYSARQDGRFLATGNLCGACHDIVTPKGVHLERTYAEWLASFYSRPDPLDPQRPDQTKFGQTCPQCHMSTDPETTVIADYEGVPGNRKYHDHRMVGVDVALTPFPDPATAPMYEGDQRAAIDDVRKSVLCGSLCVRQGDAGPEIVVWLHNETAGHNWPSGATQDRRAWVELVATKAGDEVLLESGVVDDATPVATLDDPNLWLLRDRIFDEQGEEVHMFWEAASYESKQLPVATTFFGDATTWQKRVYPVAEMPEEVRIRVRLRPMGLEVLEDLVASGDLDPAIVARMETFDVPPVTLTYTTQAAEPSETYGSCVHSGDVCRSPFTDCTRLSSAELCAMEPACTFQDGTCQPAP